MKILAADVSEFFLSSIRETVDYRQKNKIERNDFMDLMLKIMDNEGEGIALNELAQCFVFFVAGKIFMMNIFI